MAKLNYKQSLLQISVSHDPSEIILIYCFGANEIIFNSNINVESNSAEFCGNCDTFLQE